MQNSPEKHNSDSLSSKVMGEIESGRVKLRSPYLFLAEKLGLGSAIVLTIIFGVLFFALFLYYLRATDNMVYLSFGRQGVYAFLESFPYALVVAVIVLVLAGGVLLRKSNFVYKKPFGYFALGMVLFMVVAGSALAYTNVAQVLEEQAYHHMPKVIFRPFFGEHNQRRGISGRIVEVGADYIQIQAPCGVLQLDTSQIDAKTLAGCEEGRFVVAVGERRDDVFVAWSISVVEPQDIFLVNRQVHRRFPPQPAGAPPKSVSSEQSCH